MLVWLRAIFAVFCMVAGFTTTASARPVAVSLHQIVAARESIPVYNDENVAPSRAVFRIGRPQSGTPPEIADDDPALNLCLPPAGGIPGARTRCGASRSARLGRTVFARALRAPPSFS